MADRQYIKNLWEHLFDMSQNRPSDPFKEFVGRNIEEGITVSPEVMKNTKLDSYESLRIYITIRLNDALKHHQQPCSKDNKVCFDIISAAKKEYKIFMDKKIPLTESEAKNLLAYDSMLSLLAISTKIQIGALKVEDIDFEKFRALVVDANQCENIETSKIILYMLFTPLCEHYQFETCKVLIVLLTNKIQLAKEVYANRMNELINYLTRGELILMNESMMLDVEIVYLETLLRHSFYLIDSPDFNYEDSSDYKAKMTQILETLNLANTDMPCKIIANFKDAETVFKYTLIKCHQIEEFTKSNFQVLRKIDDIMKNRQQTDQVSIGGKMLYASAHNEFARYQNDAITKQTLLNKALESSLALKKDIKDKTYIVENDIVKMRLNQDIIENYLDLLRVKKELLQKSPNTKSLKQEIKQLSSKFIKLGEEIDAKFERIEFKMEHFNNRFQFYEKFSTFYREIKKDEVKRSEYARKFMLAASMIPKDHAFAKVFEELCERHL